jgi:hypothetical protein
MLEWLIGFKVNTVEVEYESLKATHKHAPSQAKKVRNSHTGAIIVNTKAIQPSACANIMLPVFIVLILGSLI